MQIYTLILLNMYLILFIFIGVLFNVCFAVFDLYFVLETGDYCVFSSGFKKC